MFKVIERSDFSEIHLRHIPEGHLYMFPVIIVGDSHQITSGTMAENPYSKTAAFRYSRQAREFAMKIASEHDYLLLPLPRFASPLSVEEPPSNIESNSATSESSQGVQRDTSSSTFSLVLGVLLVLGFLILMRSLFG